MNILVTGANHSFARAAIAALQPQHNIRAVDVAFDASLPTGLQQYAGDLRDPAFVNLVLRGVEAVLHVAPLTQPFDSDQDNLDHAARGTYPLMQAAQTAGVKQVVVASTLALFDCFPEHIRIGPTWRPRHNHAHPISAPTPPKYWCASACAQALCGPRVFAWVRHLRMKLATP